METDPQKIVDKFQKKFEKHFQEVIDNYDDEFFTEFQLWIYVLTHFTNEQIIDFTPDFMLQVFYDPEDYIDTYYEVIVPTFEKSISKTQTDLIYSAMTSKSISQGEAMIAADKAFAAQIGYFKTFCMSLWGCFEGLRRVVKEQDNEL